MQRPVRPQTGVTAPEGWDREFYDFVMSLRLKGDMKYILVKQDSNGTSVSLNLQALLDSISIPTSGGGKGGDASYKGYFAVVDDSDLSGETPIYRVKVIDSASENEYSTYYFDYKPFNVNNITLTITGSCSIVLHVTTPVDASSNPTAEMVALETVPASDEDNIYYVLAEVALTEGIMTIKQRHMGNAMLFWIGDC